MIDQSLAILRRRVEHHAFEARCGEARDQREIEAAIGEENGDQLGFGRERGQRGHAGAGLLAGDADLHIIDAGGGNSLGRRGKLGGRGEIARDSTHRPAFPDRGDDGADIRRRERAERPVSRVLEVEDIGAFDQRDFGFRSVGDAREHQRHQAPRSLAGGRCAAKTRVAPAPLFNLSLPL